MNARTLGLTAAALVAFAANSWLCRAALRAGVIDAASFTAARLGAGAAVLLLLARAARARPGESDLAKAPAGSWGSGGALFLYALAFSLAYLELDAGVGAVTLFGTVQATLLVGGILDGHRPTARDLAGAGVAFAGLVVLGAPGRAAPDPLALAGMVAAGVSWGVYSLRGRGATRPIAANAGNFARASAPALVALAAAALTGWLGPLHAEPRGLALAIVSGGLTSGLGYAAWYAALPSLTPATAGLAQLSVPVLAALGGVAFLGESITARLVAAAALVLGGIGFALAPRRRR
jgi:drug/metabolite transporter (DMT)-like permease